MPDAAPQSPCYACGYNLQGNTSGVCPECGGTMPFAFAIADPEQFHVARAMLEREALLIQHLQSGGPMGTVSIMDGGSGIGWLWIDRKNTDRVGELLDEHGITTNINARPIVDREEPFCPKCNAKLDIFGREQCSACGTHFQWVDVGEAEYDRCSVCNYDLTGLAEHRCPECGTLFRREPEIALPPRDWSGSHPSSVRNSSKMLWALLIPLILVVLIALSGWFGWRLELWW